MYVRVMCVFEQAYTETTCYICRKQRFISIMLMRLVFVFSPVALLRSPLPPSLFLLFWRNVLLLLLLCAAGRRCGAAPRSGPCQAEGDSVEVT